MNSVTSAAFRWPNFGPDEARAALIDAGAQPSCCSLEWVQNHWRWIVWKFAAQIRAFPQGYSADNLSPPFVLSQLAYRYEREVNRCQRSALKRCLERDDSASKYMCLAVAQIDRIRGCVELTDGWYSCWTAAFDGPMRELLHKDRIFLGQKLEICGAQLTGEDGIPAVEGSRPDCPVKLVICRNSVRRATWDTKLGFQFTAPAFLKQLRHVHPQGGYLPAVKVCILRCYPLAFRDDSTGHVRSEREHFEFIERSLSDRSSRSSSSFHPDELDKPDDASLSFSPIQKIRACDPERPQEVQCIITFWCPIEALPAEGTVATFTALKTPLKAKRLSWPVEDFSPILLSATKSTRIIPEATKAAARDRIPPLSIEPSSLVEIDKKGDYDVLGRFLGKSGNSLLWFCPPDFDGDDASGEAECPELPLFCLKLPSLLSHLSFAVGERVLWRDIHFLHYDSRATVYMFDYTERTDFRRSKDRAPPPSPLLLDRFLEKYKTLIK